MSALSIDMTDRAPVNGWEALAPEPLEFPLVPGDVKHNNETLRLAECIRQMENKGRVAYRRGDMDMYWLCRDTSELLWEHLKVLACYEFVKRHRDRG
jgi:hypothetical protein